MSPHRTTILGLVLCLSQMTHAQDGALRRPSISADPGAVIPWGRPVTIVCRGPPGAGNFRLEKQGSSTYSDQNTMSQLGPHETQARFPIKAVSDDTAGHYFCHYQKRSTWSQRSELLELVVTGTPGDVSSPSTQPSAGLSTEYVYILIVVSVAFLICLFLLVLFFLRCQHQKKLGLPSSRGEEQRPKERLSPAVDVLERTPDLATVDRLPEMDRERHTSASAAGGPQEVTYAQLDHQILTQRVAQAVTPPSTEPPAESSTYVALARH